MSCGTMALSGNLVSLLSQGQYELELHWADHMVSTALQHGPYLHPWCQLGRHTRQSASVDSCLDFLHLAENREGNGLRSSSPQHLPLLPASHRPSTDRPGKGQ